MAFEKFTERGRGYSPRMSVRKGGQIGLNRGAIHRFKLENCVGVILYYDKEARKIGIEKTTESDADGFMALKIRNNTGSIAGRSFCGYYGIDCAETRSYELKMDEESGYLVADLSNPIQKKRR